MSLGRLFRCVIMGAPGSGKGHISKKIAANYGAMHIAPGDILRAHIQKGSAVGMEAQKYIMEGRLVPDKLLQGLIDREISSADNKSFILDGFPRTRAQAVHLDGLVDIDFVLNLDIPDSMIVNMLKSRLVHVPSGRVYNVQTNKPKSPGVDDETGEPLLRRPDDDPKVVSKRLNSYYDMNWPVLRFYQKKYKVHTVTGRNHFILWPKVKKYMNRRLHKCPKLKFRSTSNVLHRN